MRVHGRRKALALAAVLLAGASGCSGSAGGPSAGPSTSAAAASANASPSASPAPAEPEVTLDEAGEVFSTFVATDDVLRASGDLRLAMEYVRDAEARLTAVAYLSSGGRPPRHTWGTPTLYVPRFPQGASSAWFSVLADRDGELTMLTFARNGDWRLSAAARLLDAESRPSIELDAQGYATAIADDDRSVTIRPQLIGPLHATVAETGTDGVAAGLLADGPHTTEVAREITEAREKAKKNGFSYDSIFQAGDFPVYGLRTAGGGALIQYSLSRTTTTTTKTAEDDYIPVPESARWSISAPVVRRNLRLTEINTYVTAVPPARAPAAAKVIGHSGALTKATGQ
ncbi:hypothetical protein OUY22_05460 [Nonomuraea sp. MCN248]|uniref:DUF8094 domain-containing protein n=1 Tax=Nonomuraea corallina TaxID=2989783 RepID=A0ABT4S6L8_9ACTN|nr:hypothetical protein [Nonomuraea corallina]MDA0632858.1 hypothetical protein [Nonomuraea corallina]